MRVVTIYHPLSRLSLSRAVPRQVTTLAPSPSNGQSAETKRASGGVGGSESGDGCRVRVLCCVSLAHISLQLAQLARVVPKDQSKDLQFVRARSATWHFSLNMVTSNMSTRANQHQYIRKLKKERMAQMYQSEKLNSRATPLQSDKQLPLN